MKKARQAATSQKKQEPKSRPAVSEILEQGCREHHRWIIAGIIVLSMVFRLVYYLQIADTHFIREHENRESDMAFFHEGALKIAGGDLLSKTVGHPQHQWMTWVADRYFKSHPDKLELFKEKIGQDTLKNNPVKMLWNEWYGEMTFQQEPLYPYFVALNFTLFGKDVRWVFIVQLFLGILTNLLIYLVTRRYFGSLAGAIAAFLAVFCGPMLFYEMTLLRSSMAVFLGILLIWITGTAELKKSLSWWLLAGLITGLAMTVHSFFLFFAAGMIAMILLTGRKQLKKALLHAAVAIIGLFIALSPVIYRNSATGVAPLSLSSTSALSFVTMNNESFRSFIGWNMNTGHLAGIMNEADGRLMRTIIPTLKTHPTLGSYLSQLWNKFHATFSSFEIPNNLNFYLYREFIPVLSLAFISFLILSPLALTGIFFSIYRRINAWPLYLMILVYLFPMLAFMVLSRYRIIFVPVLIPFAALAVTELLGPWKGWKNYLAVIAVVILGYWSSTTGNEKVSRVTRNDFTGIWSVHYAGTVPEQIRLQEWDKVAASLSAFLEKYEPPRMSAAGSSHVCNDRNESDIFDFFSLMHANLAVIYRKCNEPDKAATEDGIAQRLKNIAGRPPRNG